LLINQKTHMDNSTSKHTATENFLEICEPFVADVRGCSAEACS